MRRLEKLLLGMGVVGLLVVGLIVAPGASAASNCASAKNIEAIVDDSGSMSITDPDRLRVQAMNLLIDDLSPNTQLGAVEFGSGIDVPGILTIPAASTLFPPGAVGANASAMRSALDSAIKADNGATDYNGAFAKSDADNPGADARVFLTDGGHDVGTYNEAHLVHKVRTYVIGFGAGVSGSEDQARLKKIASDTGGKYFPVKDTSQLQAAMNSIGAALTCQTPPRQFTDVLSNGQSKLHSIVVGAATKTLQITLTWVSPLDKFKLSGLRLIGKNGPIAVASRSRPPGKLKVTKTTSSTFAILKVSKLRKGTLRFKVKAAKVASGAKATLTTQVGQSTHR